METIKITGHEIDTISAHKHAAEVIELYAPETYDKLWQLDLDILAGAEEWEAWEYLVVTLHTGDVRVICYDTISGDVINNDTLEDFVRESLEYIDNDKYWHDPSRCEIGVIG